ncbi:Ger(x)C family spore germination protein [Cohnella lubricantis]|uniref:Ger(X)C family spore germination protein n=1 Tax=Cohnella lubricantis TaxID=2163172 RepID=A0A841T8R9_9BACL|nr:Ger(x)C family spore germination protein [Cohnella lubricantis]MBB6677903.1 Ger(x)C family spore germination protein [Cohnella lubricantis]MBP2119086.1 Ger(x)C family germination protein [Cohnella lubricantis]
MKQCRIAAALAMLLLLPGCWSSRDIQNMAYVTAVGLDYKDGQYIAYSQVLNFQNIARTESTEVGGEVPIWVGKSSGHTVTEALGSLSATSQLRLFWGHVKVIVATERILRAGMSGAIDAINRYRDIRYNVLIYGTNEKMDDILTQKSLLNLSPLDSVLFSPGPIYSQVSPILPVNFNHFISAINEPGDPAMVPSIGINHTDWEMNKQKKPMFALTGAYFFRNSKMIDRMTLQELRGARWTFDGITRAEIAVPDKEHPIASVILGKPHYSITPLLEGNEARFRVQVKVRGFLNELYQPYSVAQLERLSARIVASEMKDTFRAGVAKRCDVLRLQRELYRKHPAKWKQLAGSEEWILNPGSLVEVKVKVKLVNTGKYKGRP